jgi:hypothetical protein
VNQKKTTESRKKRQLYFAYTHKEKSELEDAINALIYADYNERTWQQNRELAIERLKNRPHGTPIYLGDE